ncbi:MAG: DUF3084 domain-containing protein [Synergistota bacterium]|nr:DUF3084 domain-containing protein [Synergistota bacterium]
MTSLADALPEMNWQLIFFTVLLSALVAFLGDLLGMRIAKKRITLFGLRPRHTSTLITAITGMVIAMGIMTALAVTSDTVRTALFSLKYVQRQVLDLTSQLQEARDESDLMGIRYVESLQKLENSEKELAHVNEKLNSLTPELEATRKEISELRSQRAKLQEQIEALRSEAVNLRRGLEAVREGRVVAFADELLSQETVQEGASREDLLSIMSNLRNKVRFIVARRASISPEDISIGKDEQEEERVISRCLVINSRKVIRARALSNVVAGDPVTLSYRVYESVRVYRKGELVFRKAVPSVNDVAEAEGVLHEILKEVNPIAVRDGILRDPFTRTVGQIDATDFYEAVDRLKDTESSQIIVSVLAAEDIYTEGPVRVTLSIGLDEG